MFPTDARDSLLTSATSIVNDICSKKMGSMLHSPKREIDFVASLIENGLPLLTKEWSSILFKHNIHISSAGVFCHQRPIVSIYQGPQKDKRCELADILFVHSHKRGGGRIFRRAALMQVKRAPLGSLSKNELVQYELYHSWPRFQINTRGFNKAPRDFARDQRSGVYGIVDNSDWVVATPSEPKFQMPGAFSLASFLLGMLYDTDPKQKHRKSTFGRQLYETSRFDWSQTIRELINNSNNSTFRHTGRLYGNYSRPMARASSPDLLSLVLATDWLQSASRVLDQIPGDLDRRRDGRTEAPEIPPDERRGLSIFSIATDASAFD